MGFSNGPGKIIPDVGSSLGNLGNMGMVFGQLPLLSLPVLPQALDHCLSSRIKQCIINPVYNFMYTIVINWIWGLLSYYAI